MIDFTHILPSMAIVVKTKDLKEVSCLSGYFVENYLTPLRAIRRHCMECMREQRKEVDLCPSEKCPLHVYRSGHRPKE